MQSPFAGVEYYTFTEDYFFQGFSQRPWVHIETGYEFPFTLTANLFIDGVLKYTRNPFGLKPEVATGKTRVTYPNGWSVDYPDLETYELSVSTYVAANRVTNPSWPYTYNLYVDSMFLWAGHEFSEVEQGSSALFGAHGIRLDTDNRWYYSGTDAYPERLTFPYRSIEPIPPDGFYSDTTISFNAANVMLRGLHSEVPMDIYPPEGSKSKAEQEGRNIVALRGSITSSTGLTWLLVSYLALFFALFAQNLEMRAFYLWLL